MARHLKTPAQPLLQLTVVTATEAEEAVALLLEAWFDRWPVGYSEPERNTVELSVFLSPEERPTSSRLAALRKEVAKATPLCPPPQLKLQRLRPQDWKNSWRRHFRPLEIGSRLLLRPGWSRRKARRGQSVIVLDPGLSFGTGHHPTTAFCLRQLVAARVKGRTQSMVDIGTGSGILAIAAVKLGYRPVAAFDLDADSIRVARGNTRRNRVAHRIKLSRQDLTHSSAVRLRRYDLVCANLLAPLLIEQHLRILDHLKPGGRLVVAGILRKEFASVDLVYRQAGAVQLASEIKAEWQSAAYRVDC